MDKKSVKINAEKIWYTLNEVKSVSISELARILKAHPINQGENSLIL